MPAAPTPPAPFLPRAPLSCPGCGEVGLEPVCDGWVTSFLCLDCGACWRIELGHVWRLEPRTCPDCGWRGTCRPSEAAARPLDRASSSSA